MLDKFGYIGLELAIVGILILGMYSLLPKEMPIDLKVGLGLLGSGGVCGLLYLIH